MAAATVIQVKRTTTGNIPSTTEQGELFYVYDTSNVSSGAGNNGQRLFIGDPTNNTNTPRKIGGEYYTGLMDHTLGTLTADAAILVDANKKIDNLKIDNIDIDGNSIISTDTNGDINITPNGSGYVVIDGLNYPQADGTASQVLSTDGNGNLSFQSVGGTLDIAADSGTDNGVVLGTDTLTITGGTGISTSVTGDTITVNGDDATTSTKGIASFDTNHFTVSSGAVTIKASSIENGDLSNSTISIAADTGTTNAVDLGDTLTIQSGTGTGIATSVSGDVLTVSGVDATTSTKGVASFATADFAVTTGAVSIKTGGVSNSQLENNSVTIGSDSITLGGTLSAFTSLTVDNITVNGNTVTATTGNLEIDVTDSNGVIDVNNNIISGVATPVNTQDAANKQYVDDVAQGLHIHASVEVASTTNFAGFSAGTITLSSPIAVSTGIDGFTDAAHLVTGARILIKDQTNANENGIYTMNVSGSAGSEQIDSFTRADDFNTATEIAGGDFVFVIHGTEYANTGWVQTEHVDTVNTDDISFTQFSGAGTFLAGDGLTLTGNEFSVVGTSNRISVSASGVDIDTNYAGQTSITTLGTIATGTWNANVIGPVYGGTGLSSYTTGDLLYASGTNTLSALAAGTNGYILYSNNGTPAWLSAIDLTTQVTGTLPVANGGTGATTFTSNGILYGNGTNALQVTAAGTDGFILYSNNGTPAWTDVIDGGTY
jgi:hypothetical protein